MATRAIKAVGGTVEEIIDENAKLAANLRIWSALGKTDPSATKKITGKRFAGTAVKPMWINKRLTEHFGPCGIGWGMGKPDFTTIHGQDGQVLVYCTAEVWYVDPGTKTTATSTGVGGDFVIKKESAGLFFDDEAYKKAYTDALGNAWKFIGVAADIHMGLFDDNKYVAEVTAEFHPNNPGTGETGPRIPTNEPAAREKLDGPHTSKTALKAAIAKVVRAVEACESLEAIDTVKADNKRTINQARRDWPELIDGDPNCGEDIGLKGTIEKRRRELSVSTAFRFLASVVQECPTKADLEAVLDEYSDKIEALDGEESRLFEIAYNNRELAVQRENA